MTRRRSGSFGQGIFPNPFIHLQQILLQQNNNSIWLAGSNNMPKEAGMAMMALVHSKDDKKARVAAGQARHQARQGKAGGTSSSSLDLPTGVACHTSTTTNPPQPAPLAPQINTFVFKFSKEMDLFLCRRKVFVRVSHCWYKAHQPCSTSAINVFGRIEL